MAKVIVYKQWRHKRTGATASVTGAAPFTNARDEAQWEMVEAGFTVEWNDGTRGCGRPPFATEAQAELFLIASPRYMSEVGVAAGGLYGAR